MYLIHANVSYRPDQGVPSWSVWTTPDAERCGILGINTVVPLRGLFDDGVHPDLHVATALACGALGSRLLRLASSIGAQRPLFSLDLLERSE